MQYNTLVTVAASGSFLWILGPWKALTYFFFVFYLFAEMLYKCITSERSDSLSWSFTNYYSDAQFLT